MPYSMNLYSSTDKKQLGILKGPKSFRMVGE